MEQLPFKRQNEERCVPVTIGKPLFKLTPFILMSSSIATYYFYAHGEVMTF